MEGWIYCEYSTHVNGKMTPVETIPEMGEKRIKKNGRGVNSSMINLIYYKSIHNYHNLPPSSTTKKYLVSLLFFLLCVIYFC
jgi:hypothetical protein